MEAILKTPAIYILIFIIIFLPSVIAVLRRHPHAPYILMLNIIVGVLGLPFPYVIFTGWIALFGWAGAMVWALTRPNSEASTS